MENNHIDQQFNEASKLSEEPTVFPGFEKVWNKIEDKLDAKKEKKRIIPAWFPYGVAASLVIGLGAFYFINKNEVAVTTTKSAMVMSEPLQEPTLSVPAEIMEIDKTTKENIQKEKNKVAAVAEKPIVSAISNPSPLPTPPVPRRVQPIEHHYQTSDYMMPVKEEDVKEISEVVVTGFGTQKKQSVAGSSTVVSSQNVNLPQPPVYAALSGKAAGVRIMMAEESRREKKARIKNTFDDINKGYFEGNDIRLRGLKAQDDASLPLYVVNGTLVDADYVKSLDPDRIKNIEIIKEASPELYGNKAANGVVVIKTKRLSRKEKRRMEERQEEIRKQKPISSTSDNEGYDGFVENPFELTKNQPLSTFSIDVDNAAYSNIRRMINNGQIVNKDAVRIEEMVNYFKYDYPQPKNGEPFSINTEYNEAPWNPNHKLLKIGLQGKNIPMDRLPASNLIFLIDVSGSMNEENKLPLLKSSFKVLLNQLRPEDKVGIVVYAGNAGMVLSPTSASEKEKIIQALDNLQAGGSTAGGEGIELAYKLAQENFVKKGNNRVIIATDGDFNVGASSTSDLQTLIEEKRKSGVFLTCLGFGMGNYKDNTLETLADKGNGNYAYIDNMQEANKFLGKEFAGSMYAIAKDVKIQIEFNPEYVKSYRLIGYENRKLKNEDFTNDKIDAGELGSGHTVTALYEVIPAGVKSEFLPNDANLKYSQVTSSENFGEELATIKFRYKKPDEDKSREIVQVVKNSNPRISSASGDFKFASSVVWFGLIARSSELIKNKNLTDLETLAKQGKNKDEEGYRSEFIRLVEAYRTTQK